MFQKVALLALEIDMEEGFVDAGSNPLGGDARKAFATELVDQTEIWRERELLDLPVISFGGALVRYSPYFPKGIDRRSEEHTSELQSLMRFSYAVFCFKHKNYSA